jgi:hypothetical protein
LGSGRKDTLPLDNKAGYQGQLDLAALDRLKKAKDPRSVQYKIVKKNAEAHAAWKSSDAFTRSCNKPINLL